MRGFSFSANVDMHPYMATVHDYLRIFVFHYYMALPIGPPQSA